MNRPPDLVLLVIGLILVAAGFFDLPMINVFTEKLLVAVGAFFIGTSAMVWLGNYDGLGKPPDLPR